MENEPPNVIEVTPEQFDELFPFQQNIHIGVDMAAEGGEYTASFDPATGTVQIRKPTK